MDKIYPPPLTLDKCVAMVNFFFKHLSNVKNIEIYIEIYKTHRKQRLWKIIDRIQ